jgi:hypothetical protein
VTVESCSWNAEEQRNACGEATELLLVVLSVAKDLLSGQ